MQDDGEVEYVSTISGKNPVYNGDTIEDQDKCVGISYNPTTKNIAVVIQGKMTEVRDPSYQGDHFDTILLLISEKPENSKVTTITQGSLKYDMFGGRNSLFWKDEDIFFAGHSQGYETVLQSAESLDYDAYIYKYSFGKTNSCLNYQEYEMSVIDAITEVKDKVTLLNEKLITLENYDNTFPVDKIEDLFVPVVSQNAEGIYLLDTMKIPRPCAFQSQSLVPVEYYLG